MVFILLYCTVLHSFYCTVLYFIHCTVLYCIHSTVLYCNVLYSFSCTALYCFPSTVLYCIDSTLLYSIEFFYRLTKVVAKPHSAVFGAASASQNNYTLLLCFNLRHTSSARQAVSHCECVDLIMCSKLSHRMRLTVS